MKNEKKKAHFIGICGVGMSAVAKLLKDKGWEISGSDLGFYPPVSIYLEKQRLSCSAGYKSSNIPSDTDLIVMGKNTKLVPETNEEVASAYNSDIDIKSFPEVLSDLTAETYNIVCVGSYGKSTCTAIISWCLHNAGKDPSFFIGALPFNFEVTSYIGGGNIFVLEGDEYPSSNTDSTSKFMYYNARDVLFTSAEHDHVNIFKTQDDFSKPFTKLIQTIPENGVLVANIGNTYVRDVLDKYNNNLITYALDRKADWTAKNIIYGDTTTFDVIHNDKKVVGVETTLLGKHNVENIIGVAAIVLGRKILTPEEFADGIKSFKGIERRLDLKTTKSTVPVYEGFGSSYRKAESAINAIKLHFPKKRLIVVFEPHTFSWRNRDYIHHYDTIFKDVDSVYVYKPATQGSTTHEQLTHEDIVDRVKNSGVDVAYIENETDGLSKLKTDIKIGDIVLLLTSGNLDGMVQSIPKLLDNKFGN